MPKKLSIQYTGNVPWPYATGLPNEWKVSVCILGHEYTLMLRTILHDRGLGLRCNGICAEEVDLEGHGYKTVRKRQEEVGGDGSGPAPGDELREF
jgi:hypothetical protein